MVLVRCYYDICSVSVWHPYGISMVSFAYLNIFMFLHLLSLSVQKPAALLPPPSRLSHSALLGFLLIAQLHTNISQCRHRKREHEERAEVRRRGV
jgi:hypothetical protein